ncbi:MAG: M55 family metallopeptidase, partial [Deltaproteobacteria bacterium]|nr:M55 family metallopeptidase [Deltaproteobacteria bacterium]
MKIYISADIEGIVGVTDRDEIIKNSPGGKDFLEQMTAEVAAACEGAHDAGATQILVKDAHGPARSIIPAKLPTGVNLVRGWSGHPYGMMDQLDDTFQAAMMIGYHAGAGSAGNPLAHTFNGTFFNCIKLNGQYASEFLLNTYTAAMLKVPVVFVSGDKGICDEVSTFNHNIATVAVKNCIGNATNSLHPDTAVEKIKAAVTEVLKGEVSKCHVALPDHFSMEVKFAWAPVAYKPSFYPGAALHPKDPSIVTFETDSYFEVLRF